MPQKEDATQDEIDIIGSATFCLAEYLYDELETLCSNYAENNFDKLPANVVAEKLTALNKHKKLIKDAEEIAPYVDDEIAKLATGKPSALRIDLQFISRPGAKLYTHLSVIECGKKIRIQISKKLASEKGLRFPAQERAILDEIVRHEPDPKCLPKNAAGKSGVKAKVKNLLKNNPLFEGDTVFDKAWERLRKLGEVANVK